MTLDVSLIEFVVKGCGFELFVFVFQFKGGREVWRGKSVKGLFVLFHQRKRDSLEGDFTP